MTKLCTVCGSENRDEVQFCRACGTAFAALAGVPAASPEDAQLATGITCDECSFQNKAGVRYCANCGVSLLGTVIVPRSRAAALSSPDETSAGFSPPPISYPSFAPVASYPPAPAEVAPYQPDYPPVYDNTAVTPRNADPDAATTLYAPAAHDAQSTAPGVSHAPAPANRALLVIGAVALFLAAAGAGAWWFMSGSRAAGPVSAGASAPTFAASAALPATPLPIEAAPPAVAVESGPASSPLAPLTNAALVVPPTADEAAAPDAEGKRIAAEKRREKAARDKVDREAKAKALADEQQATAASATRAEQEAQARRRAEEAQRPRGQAAPAQQPPAPAQMRGVREICAGRGTIAEAICQSRTCGTPEHASEAICKQLRDADDRRRNYNN